MSKKINCQKNGESNNKDTTNREDNEKDSESNLPIITSTIDMSEIEASEESLKNYTLSKQFLKINLDKIRELVIILEEYYHSCIDKDDIVSANTVKQRIILLKRIEKEKMMIEAKSIYSNQLELVEEKMKEELDNYKLKSDQEYGILSQELENQEKEMFKTHKEEIENYKKKFFENYKNKKPRPSKDFLNWEKIKDYALKQNKFIKVQEAQKNINKYKEKDETKFKDNKDKKLNVELKKIIHKHENEKNAYEMKKKNIIEEFNRNKNKNIEIITKKYEAKLKELKNYQNFEMSNFDKITRGVIKPCGRIQSIISSASHKQNDDGDKNENEKKSEMKEENQENAQKEHQRPDLDDENINIVEEENE
jgi:hypothetical protein